jgi:hypothetical protein
MQTIYILHANIPTTKHSFMELFTSLENLNTFLNNHPEVQKSSITLHETNPQ